MYKIVYALGADMHLAVNSLAEKVNQLEQDGWIPQGGIDITCSSQKDNFTPWAATQAMVKKE